MNEIGSEYWLIDTKNIKSNFFDSLVFGYDYKLLMSGRTAIDYVLNDIDDCMKIVYMPNYCCESMIRPFKDNGYSIKYYNVDVINNNYTIDIGFKCSVFFAMSYFGYSESNMDKYIKMFYKRGITVIEDITHRLLSDTNHSKYSTYLVASLRKWFPIISGGIAVNLHEKFKSDLSNYTVDDDFVKIKQKAMQLKKEYIVNGVGDKSCFLDLFKKSNTMIENYKNKKIDNISYEILNKLDLEKVKNRRIENCRIIEKKLNNNNNIRILYKCKEGDCPLFVPIVLNNRDEVRNCLVENNIYLPVHWPNTNGINNKIYNTELSLINDQRYDVNDINKYIDKLIEIVGE